MTNLKFEGDLQQIDPRQLEFISSVLEGRGFNNGTVTVEAVGKAGDNYMANVKRITLNNEGNTFKMIAKVAPNLEAIRQMASTQIAFQNEHYIYTEILPKFTELEKAAEIPESERLRYAACYGSLTEAPNEIILLEDLQVGQFKLLDRFQAMSDDNVKMVLTSLARLHSLSYVLKNKEPMTYEDFNKKLVNIWKLLLHSEQMIMLIQHIEVDLIKIMEGDKYKKAATGAFKRLLDSFLRMSKVEANSKYNVIQQGDAWTNNLMFRFEGEKAIECCMIDYQASKETNPVADLHYFLFSCTDYKGRSKHFHEWIEYYHTELDRCLSNYGLKANRIYPKDQLDADLRAYGKIGFGLSLFLSSIMIRESQDAEKLMAAMQQNQSEMNMGLVVEAQTTSNLSAEVVAKCRKRMEEIVDSYIELGYL